MERNTNNKKHMHVKFKHGSDKITRVLKKNEKKSTKIHFIVANR